MTPEGPLKVLSYNIHKGFTPTGRSSVLGEIRDAIRSVGPDLVFLQEVMGGQLGHLAEDVWPHPGYGRNVVRAKGDHGNAILSRFPIQFSENVPILKTRFESRGLFHAVLDWEGTPLHAFCTHFGLFETHRRKQAELLRRRIEEHSRPGEPIILAGDFNDWRVKLGPGTFDHMGMQEVFLATQGAHARTFPAWLPALRLDRIYFRGFSVETAIRHTKEPWSQLSDHVAISAVLKARRQA